MTKGSSHRRYHLSTRTRLVGATVALVLFAATAAIAAPGVDPASTDTTLPAGGSTVVEKTVTTSEVPSTADIMFLADTTGSMGPAIANVKNQISTIMSQVRTELPTSLFGAAEYKDEINTAGCSDPYVYQLGAAIGTTDENVVNAVNSWSASGGCDNPEGQISALYHLGTDVVDVGWRAGARHIIVQFGDQPGHDPSEDTTLDDVIAAFTGPLDIRYIGINVGTLDLVPNDSSDSTGQATLLADATGGRVLMASDNVSEEIVSGILDVLVTPTTSTDTCDPELDITWEPAERTVRAGNEALFDETITVDETATPGSTLDCPVTFEVTGASSELFVETNSVLVEGGGDAPGAPTINQALAGNKEVGLKWSAPKDDGGSEITHYTVYADPCPTPKPAPCKVLETSPIPNSGTTFNYVIGDLTNGTTYTFTVRASNDSGEGPPSNAMSATPNGSADTDTIGANGRGTVDTGLAGGANSSHPSCSSNPSSVDCKNIVARYSLVDKKNAGAVIGLASVPDNQTPGGSIACLEFDFVNNKVTAGAPHCQTVANKALLSIYPTNVATLVRPHFAFEQNDKTVTTLRAGAPCFQLVTNANGTPTLATNGQPICKTPDFPRVFGPGPNKTNMCPDYTGWTATKPCAYIYYKVERMEGYDLAPADCAWPNCTWGTLANPKRRQPVQCLPSGPTCGKEVIIGSSVVAGIKLASGQYAVRPWCQGPQSFSEFGPPPNIKWLPCDLSVVWFNFVSPSNVNHLDVLWTDLEVNDPGGKRTG